MTERVNGTYAELLCPHCGKSGALSVIDSRAVRGLNAIRRRRQCDWCNLRFTTYEVIAVQEKPIIPSRAPADAKQNLLKARALIAAAIDGMTNGEDATPTETTDERDVTSL
jgi:transcriptional regulator NrdR family protein